MEKEIVSIISSLCIIPLNGLLKFLRDGNDTPTKLHVIDASVVAGTEDFDFTKSHCLLFLIFFLRVKKGVIQIKLFFFIFFILFILTF